MIKDTCQLLLLRFFLEVMEILALLALYLMSH
jgi:hypothetical protein